MTIWRVGVLYLVESTRGAFVSTKMIVKINFRTGCVIPRPHISGGKKPILYRLYISDHVLIPYFFIRGHLESI